MSLTSTSTPAFTIAAFFAFTRVANLSWRHIW